MWKRQANEAVLEEGPLRAAVNLAAPEEGLRAVTITDGSQTHPFSAAHLLRLQFSPELRATQPQLSDAWIRGADLIGVYTPAGDLALRCEVYWRSLSKIADGAPGVELIMSIQTDHLGAAASTRVHSDLPAGELLWVCDLDHPEARALDCQSGPVVCTPERGLGLFLWRSATIPWTYVEMVYPGDFISASASAVGGERQLRWDLLPETIEKGVIRQARLRGCFVPGAGDVPDAVAAYRAFAGSALPLTA
ncbi:MAG: hypothetical protein AB7O38_09185 [Pirellulaceae bacterium]